MTTAWNLKYAGLQVVVIMYFVAWLLYKPSKFNRIMVRAFFLLAILDTVLYFWDFKLHDYGSVYYWFAAFVGISYCWQRFTEKTWDIIK